ncbi:MAG: SH3 domain-containing protein [Stenotrophomonas sp.]|uniref:SH3 domain-containing protein n=1 Tax=Stenotrophomonas sp. TaxID=69392 RepID=UPI003D6CE1BC
MPRLITRVAACVAIVGAVLWFQPRINEPAAQVSNGLNLRSAPDQRAERLAVLPVGTTVEVQRCLDDLQWCNVRAGGKNGWVSADYLIAKSDGKRVRLADAGKELGVVIETARPGG